MPATTSGGRREWREGGGVEARKAERGIEKIEETSVGFKVGCEEGGRLGWSEVR